jgi:uncharacterized membrane protein YphA (DoxX/SURF4 family)
MDIKRWVMWPHNIVMWLQRFNFLAPVAIRAYLVPIFWMAGTMKLGDIHAVAAWFGNAKTGLGLPFPLFFAYLAALTEVCGAICLTLGLGVRYIIFPLIITMLVAIFAVHLDNGWYAIATPGSPASDRLNNLLQWLQQYYPMRHEFVMELGRPVILNNGIQYAVTYLIMLGTLFFTGGGSYFSIDYWLGRKCCPAKTS